MAMACAWAAAGRVDVRAAIVIEGRAFDGEASTKPLKDAFLDNRQPDEDLKVPLELVGVGEKLEDLREFERDAFADALVG